MDIRKGTIGDITSVVAIYNQIHTEIENGRYDMKWDRELYPTQGWAEERIRAGDLYVLADDDGQIVASAVINHDPLPEYYAGKWLQPANYEKILILHTLVVSPRKMRQGYASAFIDFFEDFGRQSGCSRLRLDTQAIDLPARNLYAKRGYIEADRVPCQFKGIHDIDLVLIEKEI